MSSTEVSAGRLTPLARGENMSLEDQCMKICLAQKINMKFYGSYVEAMDELYDEYLIIGDQLFSMYVNTIDEGDFRSNTNTDGTLDFITSFHNGGTCLAEILREEIGQV